MEVDESAEKADKDKTEKEKEKSDKPQTDGVAEGKKKEKEPQSEMLENPARVIPQQQKYIALAAGSRYAPILKVCLKSEGKERRERGKGKSERKEGMGSICML